MPVDPQVQPILDIFHNAGMPELSALPYEDLRATLAQFTPPVEARPPVADIRDVDADGIPVRLYYPAGSQPGDVRPVLVWYHGGGWVIGSVEGSDVTCRMLANRSECVVASVEYRLAPEHRFPTALDDCLAATRWVVAHADELGVDAGRLAVGGDSAGGNLAAAVCLAAQAEGGPDIRAQILIYPAVDAEKEYPSHVENATGLLLSTNDMHWFYGHYGRGEVVEATDWRLSPIHAGDHAGLPPALVVTAEFDPLRDEGEAYAAKLRAAGVEVSLTRYPGMIHGFFGFAGAVTHADRAQEEAAAALRRHLA